MEQRSGSPHLVAEHERLIGLLVAVASSRSHSRHVASRSVEIGTTRVFRLFVVSPRSVIKPRSRSTSPKRSASISPWRMPVSMAATIIAWTCGGARSSSAASSCLVDAPAALVVLAQLLDQRLGSTLERRPLDVLAADRPVQHVPQQVDDAVDARGAEHADARPAADDARLLQVGDEVLDVGGPDVGQRAVAATDRGTASPTRRSPSQARGASGSRAARDRAPRARGTSWAGFGRLSPRGSNVPARIAMRSSSSAAPASAFDWISRLAHFDRLTRTPRKLPHHGCSQRSRFRPLCSQSL